MVSDILGICFTFITSFYRVNFLMLNEDKMSTKALTALVNTDKVFPHLETDAIKILKIKKIF